MNLAALATEFLERQGLVVSTVRSYESTLLPLLQQYGRWSIEIIDRQILATYLDSLTDLSYTTHRRYPPVIAALFNFAVNLGYLQSNPMAGLPRRKPSRERGEHGTDEIVRYLTPHQLSLLYGVTSHRAEEVAQLALRSLANFS